MDKPMTLEGSGYGIYQCYCYLHSTLKAVYDQEDFCYDYQLDTNASQVGLGLVSILISVANKLITDLAITLIGRIRLNYET
mmetsp:Transcript_10117/g.15451  ORF Transcript_10117/g.15451 Transcript_10117/m.15451 type:complete len:81 (-) Transcript_10117:1350-1592(-)